MRHLGTQVLETSRLILRPFAVSDAGNMYHNWAKDPEVTKYLTWLPHSSVQASEELLALWVADYEKPDCYQWAIELKELGQAIGSISVVRHSDQVQNAEIGYALGRAWWRQGIMTEALTEVIAYLIGVVGFNRVAAVHNVNNPNSGAVMVKCGMRCEGTLRQSIWDNQGIADASWYSILAEEWKCRKREMEG